MGFSRKRGRPRIEKQKTDQGTKELRVKKALDLTTEPLELCLKKQLIDEAMYQAGLRLRHLHQLQFGAVHVRAYDPERLRGRGVLSGPDHEAWLGRRMAEYLEAIHLLEKLKAKPIVLNVCVFHQRPAFLVRDKQALSAIALRDRVYRYHKFREGLEALVKLWGI